MITSFKSQLYLGSHDSVKYLEKNNSFSTELRKRDETEHNKVKLHWFYYTNSAKQPTTHTPSNPKNYSSCGQCVSSRWVVSCSLSAHSEGRTWSEPPQYAPICSCFQHAWIQSLRQTNRRGSIHHTHTQTCARFSSMHTLTDWRTCANKHTSVRYIY